ncbi:hypothetical protein JMJ35_001253 [Cladonia borealis]|uniref:Uncharacterized protein n=1 Tax=Cladonia borealis TaxID=184061 RepID=A0AA39RA55_9LECA|nr:hypothetical protein JMJ35_001253 [Cladonia borealis]
MPSHSPPSTSHALYTYHFTALISSQQLYLGAAVVSASSSRQKLAAHYTSMKPSLTRFNDLTAKSQYGKLNGGLRGSAHLFYKLASWLKTPAARHGGSRLLP